MLGFAFPRHYSSYNLFVLGDESLFLIVSVDF